MKVLVTWVDMKALATSSPLGPSASCSDRASRGGWSPGDADLTFLGLLMATTAALCDADSTRVERQSTGDRPLPSGPPPRWTVLRLTVTPAADAPGVLPPACIRRVQAMDRRQTAAPCVCIGQAACRAQGAFRPDRPVCLRSHWTDSLRGLPASVPSSRWRSRCHLTFREVDTAPKGLVTSRRFPALSHRRIALDRSRRGWVTRASRLHRMPSRCSTARVVASSRAVSLPSLGFRTGHARVPRAFLLRESSTE
jgi:hypothetical protein